MRARVNAHSYEGMTYGARGVNVAATWGPQGHSLFGPDVECTPETQDPVYDAMVEAAANAGSSEEMMELVKKADNYFIEQQWTIYGGAHCGQISTSGSRGWWVTTVKNSWEARGCGLYLSRVWLDSDLKERRWVISGLTLGKKGAGDNHCS